METDDDSKEEKNEESSKGEDEESGSDSDSDEEEPVVRVLNIEMMKIGLKFRHLWDEIAKWSSFTLFYFSITCNFSSFIFLFTFENATFRSNTWWRIELDAAMRARRCRSSSRKPCKRMISTKVPMEVLLRFELNSFFLRVNSMIIYFSKSMFKNWLPAYNLCSTIWKKVLSARMFSFENHAAFFEKN